MKCKKEEFIEGAVFHFYNKTPERKLLFKCDNDYKYFLTKFKRDIKKYPCEVYAYCLMPNHFHFCLKQNSEKPIYRIFNDTLTSYALHYNSKYNLKGKLLQDRQQNKRIVNDSYLIAICKYIHNNPHKAGLVDDLEKWQYSNYLEYIGKRNGTLFSVELLENYHDDFLNYQDEMEEYQKNIDDKEFIDLLIDYELSKT
ncbi:MAG TPA: hypothetical protein ENL20_09810 [Candidatus Cloacimonetes bacterium]|nr:hypothetical protein [Candidatus Cloacimonadota bacterium]